MSSPSAPELPGPRSAPLWPPVPLTEFPPTRAAALARLAAVRPADYARSRNALDGAVTRLSPYITHGILDLPDILAAVAARHRLEVQHKFVFELGWREFFRHVWEHHGDDIFRSLHAGPLHDGAYMQEVPADVRAGCTGVPVIDMAVRTLYATGYLHNHARMWLASYVVHLRKVHWRAGADWMVGHLLDGDLASNHLSWQWVAGTGSSKPYLFNAENVARFAPAEWHSPGSVVDSSYEALDAVAQRAAPVATKARGKGVDEPALFTVPPGATANATDMNDSANAVDLTGRDVWLVHPWALCDPPLDLPADCLRIGWWPTEYFAQHPWSAARWAFVAGRMAEIAPVAWCSNRDALARSLASARLVETRTDPHVRALLPASVHQRPAPQLFADVDRACTSFSGWWNRTTRGVKRIEDLPGMMALAEARGSRPGRG